MKTACFAFLMISCAASMHGTGYAASSDPPFQQAPGGSPATAGGGKHQADGRPSGPKRERRQVLDKSAGSRVSLTKTNSSKRLPGNAANPQPAANRAGAAAAKALIPEEAVRRNVPARPPSSVPPSTSSLNAVRHRGPNPAVVGGSMNSKPGNNGALSGTLVHRQP
jgi:hypothetical protein